MSSVIYMLRDAEIDAQLRRILESPGFATSARSRQFLEFCVKRAVRGESSQLKETTIAVEVFLRSADYDPKSDPIVRVQARRVREKLELYYSTVGTDDPIKIDLPKGGYVPQILRTLPRRKTEFSDWDTESPSIETPAGSPYTIAGSAPSSSSVSTHKQAIRFAVGAAALLLVLLVCVLLVKAWSGPSRQDTALTSPLKPVALGPDPVSDFAWSPDGTMLAYTVAKKDEKTRIYIKQMPGEALPVRLTESSDGDESRPVWSPDGKEIAFAKRTDLAHTEIDRLLFASRKITPVGRFVSNELLLDESPALDWSPDGRSLLTAEQAAPGNPMRLIMISLATGERTALTSPPTSSTGDVEAKFSPDGQWIAFRRGGLGDLYLVSIKGEQSQPATRLTFDTKGVRGIAWIDQGRSILFGTQRDKTTVFGLWKIAREGGNAERVSPQDFDAVEPAVSSKGMLALEHRELITSLVEHTLTSSTDRVLLPSNSVDAFPVYAPDAKSFAFTSTRTGCTELWLREQQSEPRQLTHFQCSGIILLPSFAPDGQSIVLSFRENGATNLFLYDLAANNLKKLTSTRNRDISPAFSNDGRYIYYSSNDDGTSRIWRRRTDGATRPEPLFVEAVAGFEPSPDGRWLYYIHATNGVSLLRRNLQDGTTEEVFHTAGRPSFLNSFVIANQHIYLPVSQDDLSRSQVFMIDPETKRSRIVTRLHDLAPNSIAGLPGFSVSADGNRIITGHTERNEATLYTADMHNAR